MSAWNGVYIYAAPFAPDWTPAPTWSSDRVEFVPGVATPQQGLTEADMRRIVREELRRLARDGECCAACEALPPQTPPDLDEVCPPARPDPGGLY